MSVVGRRLSGVDVKIVGCICQYKSFFLVVRCRLSSALSRLRVVADVGGCCLFLVVGCWLAVDCMLWLSCSLLHSVLTVAPRKSMTLHE